MQRSDWHTPTTDDIARRRAGGRARYNARRQQQAIERRVYRLLPLLGGRPPKRGALGGLAAQLHVSRATICRDIASLRRAHLLDGRMGNEQLEALARVGEKRKEFN